MIYMMKGSSAALAAAAAAAGEGALGAKTARACDSCLKRRARWFCGADDAFLCHSCDTLVHSANQLASRHERVRLQTASAKVTTWHSGFTRKARTPRHNKHLNLQQQRLKDQVLFNTNTSSILPLVPELGREEEEEELEQKQPLVDYDLLCRVPVFNVDDIYNTTTSTVKNDEDQFEGCDELESFSEFDVDLAEFAANVESLLGVGSSTDLQVHHHHHHHHEGEKSNNITSLTAGAAGKVKDEVDDLEEYSVFDMTISTDEMFHWNIDDDSSHHQEEKDEYYCEELVVGGGGSNNNNKEERKRERFLRLNYEEVISAWTSSQGCNSSPWTTGNPPPNNNNFTFDDDSWPNYLGTNDEEVMNRSLRGKYLLGSSTSSSGDGGREARVSRYREKRRTRLFAKKIRYEVRKLNAEKRPRMKGRFVKRSNFVGVGVGVGGANTTTTTDHHFPTNYH